MSARAFKRRLDLSVDFVGLAALLCLSFLAAAGGARDDSQHILWTKAIFSLSAGGMSFALLRFYGFFNPIRYLPKPTDFVFFPLAMIPAGALASEAVRLLTGAPGVGFLTLMTTVPLLGALAFAAFYLLNWSHYRNERRTRIVLKLLPDEETRLRSEFVAAGLNSFVSFLSMGEAAQRILRSRGMGIDLIVFSRGAVREMQTDRLLVRAHLAGVPIVDRRRISAELTGSIPLSDVDLWTYVTGATQQTTPLRVYTRAKALLEPLVGAALLILLAPLFAVIALLIRLSSPGPVFYVQNRAGYLGRPFNLVKFRSMRIDSEKDGVQWATKNDDRTTSIGRFIRKVRLDELPQLFNVVRGEMGFIGPRPERPEFCRELEKAIPLFSMRTDVRPGITGWAQVCAGYAASVEESRVKLEHDLYYIQHMSPALDLLVVLKTMKVMLLGQEHKTPIVAPTLTGQGGGGKLRGPSGPKEH
ncbi:MAG: sugar transferase [Bdellovibrionales bacterium]|nr:sugar transferase [Bdellovibrionales bacterium]